MVAKDRFLFQRSAYTVQERGFRSNQFSVLLRLSKDSVVGFSVVVVDHFGANVSRFYRFHRGNDVDQVAFSILVICPVRCVSGEVRLGDRFFLDFFDLYHRYGQGRRGDDWRAWTGSDLRVVECRRFAVVRVPRTGGRGFVRLQGFRLSV